MDATQHWLHTMTDVSQLHSFSNTLQIFMFVFYGNQLNILAWYICM